MVFVFELDVILYLFLCNYFININLKLSKILINKINRYCTTADWLSDTTQMDSKASFNKLYNYLTLVGEYFKINYYHKKNTDNTKQKKYIYCATFSSIKQSSNQ